MVEPLRIKIDPGANATGIAIVNDASGEVLFAADLRHRGFAITASLTRRRSYAGAGDSGILVIANPASRIATPTRRAGFLHPCKAG